MLISIKDFLEKIKDGTEIIIKYLDYPDAIDFEGTLNDEVRNQYFYNDYNVKVVTLDGEYMVIYLS